METMSVSEAKARLNELARTVHEQHARFTLTRNGAPEAVLVSVDDLEGLELTLEILADESSVAAIGESLAEIERGDEATDVSALLARRRGRTRTLGE